MKPCEYIQCSNSFEENDNRKKFCSFDCRIEDYKKYRKSTRAGQKRCTGLDPKLRKCRNYPLTKSVLCRQHKFLLVSFKQINTC